MKKIYFYFSYIFHICFSNFIFRSNSNNDVGLDICIKKVKRKNPKARAAIFRIIFFMLFIFIFNGIQK